MSIVHIYVDVKTKIYKLFNKYERKFGAARSQRATQPASHIGKRKQAWGRIFGGPGFGVVGPSPASAPTSSTSGSVMCELTVYIESDKSLHMRMILIYFSGGATTN